MSFDTTLNGVNGPVEPTPRLHAILRDLGFDQVYASDALLKRLGMSRTRFNQIAGGKGLRIPLSVGEANALRLWLREKFTGLNAHLFTEDAPAALRAGRQLELNDAA